MNDFTKKLINRITFEQEGKTHYDGCEKVHTLCACVKELEAQALEIEKLKAYIKKREGVES